MIPTKERSSQEELEELLASAKQHSPGVCELIEVYRGYEEAVREAGDYLRLLDVLPTITTSNQSFPELTES
jgi:hypothetical protein